MRSKYKVAKWVVLGPIYVALGFAVGASVVLIVISLVQAAIKVAAM